MKVDWPVEIAGTGASAPANVVTNQWFADRIDTSDDWIVQRTGIRERRIAPPGESTLHYSTLASRQALEAAAMQPADIDLILHATISPEHPLPSTACELQHALGCRQIAAYDMAAACSGFVYGLIAGSQSITLGLAERALVLGSECLSRFTDMDDRTTAVIFGDGAGAAVIRRSTSPERRILAVAWGADGGGAKSIWIPGGGSSEPASAKTVNERLHTMRMKGREVYKFAVTKMEELIEQTAADAGISVDQLNLVIPHQSNLRIIESACEKLRLPMERVLINIDRYGNTSAASIPIGLAEATRVGRLKRGDYLLVAAFGAGLTWASVVLRY